MKKVFCIILSVCLLSGCSTMTQSQKRSAYTVGGAALGGVVGAATTPDDTSTAGHTALWAGVAGVVTALVTNYFMSGEKENESLKKETERLKTENDRLKNAPKFKTVSEKAGYFDDPFNRDSKDTVWEVKKGSQWVDDGPDEKYHINMRLKKKKEKSEKK